MPECAREPARGRVPIERAPGAAAGPAGVFPVARRWRAEGMDRPENGQNRQDGPDGRPDRMLSPPGGPGRPEVTHSYGGTNRARAASIRSHAGFSFQGLF
ncbi:hypothetical protein GCM10010505_48450 [Kitasatospora aburaviensis]